MIMMHLTFQIILLAIGFGVGYWLLIAANSQIRRKLSVLGSILGSVLIVLTIIVAILNCYYSNKMFKTGYMHRMMSNPEIQNYQNNPTMNKNRPIR